MRTEEGKGPALPASLVELERWGRGGDGVTASDPKGSQAPAATRLRVGSVWSLLIRSAIVVEVEGSWAWMRTVAAGRLGRRSRVRTSEGAPNGYTFVGQQPTLRCGSTTAVEEAIRHLRAHNIGASSAFACGLEVVVAMTPASVIQFAETALQRGWADDADCARMIGDLE